jgi:TM2 domain-containing membrane protein YozV
MESVSLEDVHIVDRTNSEIETSNLKASDKKVNKTRPRVKSKAVAITLAVTLGVFGVHRLYLGTSNKVPIIYTLTLGGGFGVLVVSDIVAIIATKNLDEYTPSEKVFMWAK